MASAAVLASVLVFVGVGYPDWLWFPLTISFWVAVATLMVTVGLEIRSRLVRA